MLLTTKPFLLPHRLSNIKTQFNQCYSHISQKNPSIKLSIHIISPISKKTFYKVYYRAKVYFVFLSQFLLDFSLLIYRKSELSGYKSFISHMVCHVFFFFFKLVGSSLVVIFSVASEKQAVNIIKVQISYFLLCLYCILSKIYLLLQMS